MSLKDQLFPDSNITGKTDRNNQPILVGQTIMDETGCKYLVGIEHGCFVVSSVEFYTDSPVKLNTFMVISEWVEIVVPADKPDETPVAIAPFDKEHNSPRSFVDEMGTLPSGKYKSVSTNKIKRLP